MWAVYLVKKYTGKELIDQIIKLSSKDMDACKKFID